ncbi:MAG: ABC transporter substrate-binding protein [Bacteroidetes bacterium]|jgi:iron complex transport system substrate-binding protein|nr:ABC transporter substrate-binding protein [Bacteroidota bacterium]MCA6442407.1 ABC transporter substrate-binding protein [Bacteroidota bacterium]
MFACKTDIEKTLLVNQRSVPQALKYAKRFSIAKNGNKTIIYLFGNKSLVDTTNVYILSDSIEQKVTSGFYAIQTPVKSIISLSSLYSYMITELGSGIAIKAIENIEYYSNPQIIQQIKEGKTDQVHTGAELNLEKIIKINPSIVFGFGMPNEINSSFKKLNEANIPTVLSFDHLEESPLARAEWLKFYACFLGKYELADSLFNLIEADYLKTKSIAADVQNKPTVFTELKYGDVWYVPGGKSFMSNLLADAGADYIFKSDTHTGSLALSYETVYLKCKSADFWLNLSTSREKKDLLKNDIRNKEFKAFQLNHLFNNTKVLNSYGYSNYWESGLLYPNKILNDMISIFHFRKFDSLYYYQQLN